MNLNIEWTPVALQSLDEVYEYTFEEFGKAQVRKLTNKYTPLPAELQPSLWLEP